MKCIKLGKVIVLSILLIIASLFLKDPIKNIVRFAPSVLFVWWVVGLVVKCDSYV